MTVPGASRRCRTLRDHGWTEFVSLQDSTACWSANPVVNSPLIGATRPHHLADAVAALDVVLTADEIAALEAPYVPRQPTYFD